MIVRYTKEQIEKMPHPTAYQMQVILEKHKDDPEDPECPFMTDEQLAQFRRHYPKTA